MRGSVLYIDKMIASLSFKGKLVSNFWLVVLVII